MSRGRERSDPPEFGSADDDPWNKTRTDGHRVFSATQPGMGFDVRLVHDSSEPWRAIELWTARSIYWLDHDRTCIAVVSRDKSAFDTVHRFLGARVVGGQQRGEHGMSVAQPLPIPGMSAVFRLKAGFAMTSAVEQILIQVKIDNIPLDGDEPDWNNLATLLRAAERR
ncbi:MAG: hypothetical protein AB7O24_12350 [Kofleriaceae bacterium]